MSPVGLIRGHSVFWDKLRYRYSDTNELVPDPDIRPCPSCHKPPTLEGYDACLDFIPGVRSACCGHGKPEDAYVVCKRHDWSVDVQTSGPGWQTLKWNAKCARCGKARYR